jgi:uncharacterized protein involved in exopolysaccharide biosynthesis
MPSGVLPGQISNLAYDYQEEVIMSDMIIHKVVEQLRAMPYDLQQEVLYFTRKLKASTQVGMPGKNLLQFAGTFPLDDLEIMRRAIEADCGRVDLNEW